MEFNYTSRMKQFCREWEQLRKDYAAAGMSEEAINKMYEYDLEDFRKERIYCMHTQFFPEEPESAEDIDMECKNPLYQHFLSRVSKTDSYFSVHGRYAWICEVENVKLRKALKSLSSSDKELLTLLVIEEHQKQEIGKIMAIGINTVTRRIERIKNILKIFLENGEF